MAMVPRSGRSNPAIMLTSDVLPEPEAPNSPVTLPSLANEASIANSPSFFETSTRNMINSHAGAHWRAARTIRKRPVPPSR